MDSFVVSSENGDQGTDGGEGTGGDQEVNGDKPTADEERAPNEPDWE